MLRYAYLLMRAVSQPVDQLTNYIDQSYMRNLQMAPEYEHGENWLPATWSRYMACVIYGDTDFFLCTDEQFEG